MTDCGRFFRRLRFALPVVLCLCFACAPPPKPAPFNPVTCMETVPEDVEGLEILAGPRTRQSIIRDMVPVVCNAQVLFRKMNEKGETIEAGTVVFRVTVEYTGEVYRASVQEATIASKRFLREISDFIMDTDFAFWTRHDEDTVFLYPITFRV